MNKLVVVLFVVGLGLGVNAEMVYFKGIDASTITTGDLLEGVRNLGITTNVQEIMGLLISARSGETNQQLNANNSYFGINDTLTTNDVADAFDVGERMIISFSKDIQVNRLDFNQFTAGESITVSVAGDVFEIHDLELTHRGSDYLDTNLVVAAGAEIEFYTTGSSVVGLDGIDLTVLGGSGELLLSLIPSNHMTHVTAHFDGAATTNYILQSCTNMVSNAWVNVSSFVGDTNWVFNATNDVEYYRAIID
ncbi:hypothetical protein PDESU_00684 [Pontiella desulfatans]|uniref:Uncharacterized protein n=1 Tax=Pontiella desulfatans TaxID=2750659 RepID=A0A6C2TX05_PONDE|nr:hypothetical protein [Pontiella desulfatans]VGO12133.1 hypothetical protein PDESU_00684 [Pontiella desulfatans]